MIFLVRKKPLISSIILIFIALICCLYFLNQSLTGNYNWQSLENKKKILSNLLEEYENNNADINFYNQKINKLSPENLDIDLVEEEMKKRMILVGKDEIVILKKE